MTAKTSKIHNCYFFSMVLWQIPIATDKVIALNVYGIQKERILLNVRYYSLFGSARFFKNRLNLILSKRAEEAIHEPSIVF